MRIDDVSLAVVYRRCEHCASAVDRSDGHFVTSMPAELVTADRRRMVEHLSYGTLLADRHFGEHFASLQARAAISVIRTVRYVIRDCAVFMSTSEADCGFALVTLRSVEFRGVDLIPATRSSRRSTATWIAQGHGLRCQRNRETASA